MKKILLFMLCLLIAVSGGACAPEDENLAKAKNLWGEENVILSDDGATFELTPGLISWFYQYTQAKDLEIAYMPEFSAAEKPDWDDLTRYIYYIDMQENNFNILSWTISKDEFRLLVEKYLPTASYTDGPSMYLNYDNECYSVRGFDFVGSNHFRLSDLTVDEEGIFTAQFVVAYFEEFMTVDIDNPSPNLQALYDFSNLEGILSGAQVREIVEEIFLLDNYQDILDMTYYVTIEFRLSDDEEAPFQYLSCHRERLDGSEYSLKGM